MAYGKIRSLNKPSEKGVIERVDDISYDFYNFRIPEDCISGYYPTVANIGDSVKFTPINENGQRATGVELDGDDMSGGGGA